MTAFSPSTAYSQGWQFYNDIEDVCWERQTDAGPVISCSLKAKFGDRERGDLQGYGSGIAAIVDVRTVTAWEVKPATISFDDWEPQFDPAPGHVLRKSDGEGWLIVSIAASTFGKWILNCQLEQHNG